MVSERILTLLAGDGRWLGYEDFLDDVASTMLEEQTPKESMAGCQ